MLVDLFKFQMKLLLYLEFFLDLNLVTNQLFEWKHVAASLIKL